MPNNVFITGALGFLGKFFVRELLEQDPEARLFLLVRGNDKASPEERVRAAGLPREAVAWERTFTEPNENIVFVEIGKGE